jgi:hypothetical protein
MCIQVVGLHGQPVAVHQVVGVHARDQRCPTFADAAIQRCDQPTVKRCDPSTVRRGDGATVGRGNYAEARVALG